MQEKEKTVAKYARMEDKPGNGQHGNVFKHA